MKKEHIEDLVPAESGQVETESHGHGHGHGHKDKPRVLFLCNKRLDQYGITVGLLNEANFSAKVLDEKGIAKTKVVRVIDSNFIDREVHHFRPTHVMIEAIWVPPYKFKELIPLHPTVTWCIRLHSNLPFLANEGIAMKWLFEYAGIDRRVKIGANNLKMVDDISFALGKSTLSFPPEDIIYLPNIYDYHERKQHKKTHMDHIDVGCFGAIRPLKNQLVQALAAIKFGENLKKPIKFHMNANRIERGENAMKNIHALFANNPPHKLVEHPWYPHDEFIEVLRHMDICLQVSFSETFNIVSADSVACGVPIVVSEEISWASSLSKVSEPTSSSAIAKQMTKVWYENKVGINFNRRLLKDYIDKSLEAWGLYLHA